MIPWLGISTEDQFWLSQGISTYLRELTTTAAFQSSGLQSMPWLATGAKMSFDTWQARL